MNPVWTEKVAFPPRSKNIHVAQFEMVFSASSIFHNISVQLFDAAPLWCQPKHSATEKKKPVLIYIQYTSLANGTT